MYDSIFISRGLSLGRLKVLLEVDEAGSISGAAESNPVRQSQYSRQLKELESFFGCELTLRDGRYLRLTERGKKLALIARENLTGLSDFLADCEKQTTILRIGAGESIIRWLITPRLSSISKRLPTVSFDFRNIRSQEAITQLSQSQIDLAIVRAELVPDHLESRIITSLDYALYIPKSFAKKSTKRRTPPLHKLTEGLPLGRMESGGRLATTLQAADTQIPVLLMDSLPSLCNAIASGYCCGVLPTIAEKELPEKSFDIFFPPEVKKMSRKLALVWNNRFEVVRHNAKTAIDTFAAKLSQ
jgi:DNA-binding transcriptional LysR family regulator